MKELIELSKKYKSYSDIYECEKRTSKTFSSKTFRLKVISIPFSDRTTNIIFTVKLLVSVFSC